MQYPTLRSLFIHLVLVNTIDATLTTGKYVDSIEVRPQYQTRSMAVSRTTITQNDDFDDDDDDDDFFLDDDTLDDDFDDDDYFFDDDIGFDDDDEDDENDVPLVSSEAVPVHKPHLEPVIESASVLKPEGYDSWSEEEKEEYDTFMATKMTEFESTHDHSHLSNEDVPPSFGEHGELLDEAPEQNLVVATEKEEEDLEDLAAREAKLILEIQKLNASMYEASTSEDVKKFELQIEMLEKKLANLENNIFEEEDKDEDMFDEAEEYIGTNLEILQEEIESAYFMIRTKDGTPEEIKEMESHVMELEAQLASYEGGGDQEVYSNVVESNWKDETFVEGQNGHRLLRG